MPSSSGPSNTPHRLDLDVRGVIPAELSGRLIGIGRDGFVHSLHVQGGRVSYFARRTRLAAPVLDVVAFEGSILLFGDDASVHELSVDAGPPRRVDLAGHGRALVTCPKHDTASGELHLVARDTDGEHEHVVVTAGALTRRSRPIDDVRGSIRGLALSRDHVVFVADGAVGVVSREGDPRPTWFTTDAAAPNPVHASSVDGIVILLVLTPPLERWILHPGTGAIEREPVDSRSLHLGVAPLESGEFALANDPARPGIADGGWFVGLLHDAAGLTTELGVIDTADPAGAAVATIRLPRRLPLGLRCAWMPSTPH